MFDKTLEYMHQNSVIAGSFHRHRYAQLKRAKPYTYANSYLILAPKQGIYSNTGQLFLPLISSLFYYALLQVMFFS